MREVSYDARVEFRTVHSIKKQTPMLLPLKHHMVDLIISDNHQWMLHSGVNTTLTSVREWFWILQGRRAVKRCLRRCVTCRKGQGQPFPQPQTPDLPKERGSDCPPFTHTGVDFAGTSYTTGKGGTNTDEARAYVCLFMCASTRAVAFLLAFRRFTSRRGLPATLLSDNAKTFKSASKEVVKITRAQEVLHYLANNSVTWKFIVEKAPWWGGFWEHLVQTVKRQLRK